MILCTIFDSKCTSHRNRASPDICLISAFTSTILKLTYGMNISEGNDSDYVRVSELVMAAFAEAGHPGSFLVDLFPSMKFIPAWFPGAGWKRKANYWRKLGEYFSRGPWDTVKEQLV